MRLRALVIAALACACAPRADLAARKADRVFLHEGMREYEVISSWGKPDSSEPALDNGRAASVWTYDRVYKQKQEVAYWPRSTFTLTFIDGRLRRWTERAR